MIWGLLYCAAMGGFVWLLHKGIGNYPPPLPRSEHPRRERWGALGLWSLAVSVSILRMAFLDPALAQAIPERSWREVALVPLLSLPYLAVPLWVMLKMDGRPYAIWRHSVSLTGRLGISAIEMTNND